jgi:hypothetical protein
LTWFGSGLRQETFDDRLPAVEVWCGLSHGKAGDACKCPLVSAFYKATMSHSWGSP